MNKFSRQQGVALITVMLIVALAAILATQMSAKLQMHLQRTANIEMNQQAYWYAMGAEAFAKRVLTMSFDGQENVTHLGQLWATGETSYPVDFGSIKGEIIDLQSCFNLNALRAGNANNAGGGSTSGPTAGSAKNSHELAALALEKLIVELNIENVGNFEAKDMVDALTDWLDSDSLVSNNGGAEDNEYASKPYPYLPANHYLASFNELRLIEHFTLPIIDAIKPYVCVIPNTNLHKINVNTLNEDHAEILMALFDIPKSVAQEIMSSRGDEGYEDVEGVFILPQLTQYKLTQEQKDQLVVDSEYFTLKTETSFNSSYFFLSSIMKIDNNKHINIISRSIGRD